MTTVLAVAEHRRGSVQEVTHQLITAGRQLADDLDGELHLGLVGGAEHAEAVNRAGVDVIHTVEWDGGFNHGAYVQALSGLAAELGTTVLLTPHSVAGLDYAPAVAERLEWPLVTDAIEIEADGELRITREMYGSKVATRASVDLPAVVTVRGAEWEATDAEGDAVVETSSMAIDEDALRSTVIDYEDVVGGDVDITQEDVLVSVGRGIGDEDHLEMIFDLADALGAGVSASRPIVDSGWLPKNRQVGQSGQTVTPDVYIALGISGAVQHVTGMKDAGTIIVVNTDPSAPIFDIADYAVVGDLFEVVPALIEAVGD